MASEQQTAKKSYTTPLLVGLLIVAVFVIGMMWQKMQTIESDIAGAKDVPIVAKDAQPQQPQQPQGEVTPVNDADHIRGNKNARIVWIEYSDYECPFCTKIHPDLVKLLETYPDEVQWVYRHFPLDSLHPNARPLALGAECVAELVSEEAFWEYTDLAYEQQAAGADPVELGVSVGASQGEIEDCIDENRYMDKIDDDLTSGQKAGVTGTPGNIILDTETGEFQLIPGALPYAQLEAVVSQLLES